MLVVPLKIIIGIAMINLTLRQQVTLCSFLAVVHVVLFVIAPN